MASSQQLILGEGAGGAAPVPQYQISRSLRFNSADSASLNRTPSSAGNRKTWTWSGWVKKSLPTGNQQLFAVRPDASNLTLFYFFVTGEAFRFTSSGTSIATIELITTQVFRDPSAWYHIVVALDTTQATASNRAKIYVNGTQVTAFTSETYPAQNSDSLINSTNGHRIGAQDIYGNYLDGYMTEVNFIDGQALTPSSFGQTNANTGVWEPKPYTGTYGTNGFYLNFSDNSNTTAATLGKDYSGNGNNWTPNNFSVTAGVGNDSLVDTPTPYGTDTGVGGEVRGNYATWNPLWYPQTWGGAGFYLANGNLQAGDGSDLYFNVWPTIMPTTGKWYLEKVLTASTAWRLLGIQRLSNLNSYAYYGSTGTSTVYMLADGDFAPNTTSNAAWYGVDDVISMAIDFDNRAVWFAKNGSWIDGNGSESSSTVKSQIESGNTSSAAWTWASTINDIVIMSRERAGISYTNFGQRAFSYTAPSGFKVLCTQNLPTPTIGATSTTQAGKYFNTVLWTGNNSTNRSITGVGFQPDLVWTKGRNAAWQNFLQDAIRGAVNFLISDSTNAEATTTPNIVSSFNSDGFVIQNNGNTNTNNDTYVAWNWKANGAGVTNTAGTITSTVSANTTSGFSIVSFTAPASGSATVGHGLGAAPSMMIWKSRSNNDNWTTYHSSLGNNAVFLNLTNAASSITWGTINSTIFTVDVPSTVTANRTYVAYCFAPVASYSSFGSYVGNGADDGPFNYLGFRAAWILVKRSSSAGEGWWIYDNKRSPYNIANVILSPDSSGAEISGGTYPIDINSNGFKIRGLNGLLNTNGATYIYAAFAEFPFKYTLAR